MQEQKKPTRTSPREAATRIAMEAIKRVLESDDPRNWLPEEFSCSNLREIQHYLSHRHDVLGNMAGIEFVPLHYEFKL